MGAVVNALADRIVAIRWAGTDLRTRSRALCMREYLRRSAWWAQAVRSPDWPFFDLAAAINSAVRADPQTIQRALHAAEVGQQGVQVLRAAERALHFAALMDVRQPMPAVPPTAWDPFEPLLRMFERGGGFRVEGSGLIEVDTAGIPRGTMTEHLVERPVVSLDHLDAFD